MLMINSEIENLIQSLVYDFHARMIQNQIFKLLKRGVVPVLQDVNRSKMVNISTEQHFNTALWKIYKFCCLNILARIIDLWSPLLNYLGPSRISDFRHSKWTFISFLYTSGLQSYLGDPPLYWLLSQY